MKKENGSVEAVKKDRKLKDYQNSKVINYVRLFRHFADNKQGSLQQSNSCSNSTDTVSTKMAESSLHNDDLEECKEAEADHRQATDEFNGLQYEIDSVLIGEIQFPTNK